VGVGVTVTDPDPPEPETVAEEALSVTDPAVPAWLTV
jgi:hypothetical protein